MYIHVHVHVYAHYVHVICTCMLCLFTASQCWTLGLLLPLMVGDKVPEGDPKWQHYISFLETISYFLAAEILPDEVAYAQVLLTNFLEEFTELYPGASIIPKLHYLIHVPRLILK